MRRTVFILTALLALLATSAFGDSWTGRCVAITDGDSIRVMHSGRPEKIRLYGIDCPERRQPFGTRARQFTSDLVFGKVVQVEPVTTDRYGRTVALVFVDGKSISHELVKAGLAWWYRKYAPSDQGLARLETEARAAGRGLWSQPEPVAPWEWRKVQSK